MKVVKNRIVFGPAKPILQIVLYKLFIYRIKLNRKKIIFSKYFGKYFGILKPTTKSTAVNVGDLSGFKIEFWKYHKDFHIFFAFEV